MSEDGNINTPDADIVCESGTWSRRSPGTEQTPLVPKIFASSEPENPTEKRGLILSLIILVLSIPALVGAWCWPALVIGLITGTVSAAARTLGHWISFGITLGMMIIVLVYMVYSLKKRSRKLGFVHKYGPLICVVIAIPLIMADLTRHILQDQNIWLECQRKPGQIWGPQCLWSSSQYHCNLEPPNCIPTRQENLAHLSMIGVLFTIVFTYTGFIFLTIGSLWNANFLSKMREIKKTWSRLRGNA